MVIDLDFDLAEPYREIVTGTKKKGKVTDFEFTKEGETKFQDPIEEGQNRLIDAGQRSTKRAKARRKTRG